MQLYSVVIGALLPLLVGGSSCDSGGDPHAPLQVIRIKEKGDRGWLGVSIRDMRPSLAREMKVSTKVGALVVEVVDDSPAKRADIARNDVIVEFNGESIEEADDLRTAVRETKPGTQATVTLMRKDQKKNVRVTLESLPAPEAITIPEIPPVPPVHVRVFTGGMSHGLGLLDLNRQLGEYFGAPEGKGVLVEEVRKRSAAKEAGFKAGDVILRIGAEEIEDADDVWKTLQELESGDTVEVSILRRGSPLTLRMEVDESSAFGHHGVTSYKKGLNSYFDARALQFDKQRMERQMKEFQEQLRSTGKEIRERIETLRTKVHKELRRVTT